MDNALLGYKPFYYRWCKVGGDKEKKSDEKRPEKIKERLESFAETFVEPLIRFIKEGLDEKEKKGALFEIQPRTELNLVKQMCSLVDILIEDTKYMELMDEELLNRIFIFSCVWGLGSCLEFNDRKKF